MTVARSSHKTESRKVLAGNGSNSQTRRLRANYADPIPFPAEIYAGCGRIAERIVRARRYLIERDGAAEVRL